MNKQLVAEWLSALHGMSVSVGLHRWIEDVRDPATGIVTGQIVHDEGEKFVRADGVPVPQSDLDQAIAAVLAAYPGGDYPMPVTVAGDAFLARITDAEYLAAIAAAGTNVQIARWIEILRMNGEINLAGATAQAAKAGLVAAGIMSQARADQVFAP